MNNGCLGLWGCVSTKSKMCRTKDPQKYKDYYNKWYGDKGKDWVRNYNLQHKYGISLKDYKKLLKKQNNKCAICGKDQKNEKRLFSIDHNHKTRKIRGILCTFCNHRLLGCLRDDKNKSQGLVRYLSKALKEDKDWK